MTISMSEQISTQFILQRYNKHLTYTLHYKRNIPQANTSQLQECRTQNNGVQKSTKLISNHTEGRKEHKEHLHKICNQFLLGQDDTHISHLITFHLQKDPLFIIFAIA